MNRNISKYGAAWAALSVSSGALAQDGNAEIDERQEVVIADLKRTDIIVAASRGDELVFPEDYAGSVTVLDADALEARQTREIGDVLRDVPGVAVSAVPGQTQIRLRGSEANHVLVLVDGIEVSDPGSGEFDIGTLQSEIGSSVEVLRGPQSALYGSDAIAGVVAYRSGEFKGVSARLETGSNDTVNGAARFGFAQGGLRGSISANVVSTDGEPNARPVNGNGVRDIGRESYTVSGKFTADISQNLQVRAVGRYAETEGRSNDQDFDFTSPTLGLAIDSPGVGFESEALYGLVGAQLAVLDGSWTHDLSVQFADLKRNTFAPFGLTSDTTSDRFKLSYVSAYDFGGSGHSLTFAADYEEEGYNNVATFDDRKETENVGLVGEYRYSGETFDISAAIRRDFNDRFQDTTTFRLGTGLAVTESTRLRASVGTGVKNPNFNELFGFFDGRFVGNPDLQPEESTSWEVGVDQSFGDGRIILSATYFNADLDAEIFTVFGPPPTFTASPANRTTESKREGIEVAVSAQLSGQWSFDAAYTYIDSEENGAPEIRRPENTASAALNWTAPGDRASATLLVRHNGEMGDTDFGAFVPVTLDDYTLVNFNARYRLSERIELFGRVENLLDETYEQVFSFVSPGRSVIGGVSISL